MADGNTYYVIVVDGTTIKLADTLNNANANSPIDLTAAGAGTGHHLTDAPNVTVASFDGATAPDTGDDTITLGAHTFLTGDEVVYTSGGGTDIVGLTNGTTYYVIVVDGTTIKLADTFANANADLAVVLTAVGAGADHRLTDTVNSTFKHLIDDINRAIGTTVLAGLITAERYENQGTNRIRLTADDESVVKFELTVAGGDPADTVLGLPTTTPLMANLTNLVEILSQGDRLVLNAYSDEHTFDVATDVDITDDTITITNHGLVTGRAVDYSPGGGTVINGLASTTYYAIAVDANTVKLATSEADALAGNNINFTGAGTGSAHTLTVNPIAGFTVNGSGVGFDDLGFTNGQTANSNDFIIKLTNGSQHIINLNGATTIGDVISKIVDQTGGNIGALNFAGDSDINDYYGMTFGDVGVEINDDDSGLKLEDKTWTGVDGTPVFYVQPTNASPVAIRLGILKIDPSGDFDLDGDVDGADGDGIIDGGALVGAGLAGRFFIENLDITFGSGDVSTASDTINNFVNHGLATGRAVEYSNGGGTDIGGLTNGTTYYAIVVNSSTIKLATTSANAQANTAINLTTAGSGLEHSLTVMDPLYASFDVSTPATNFTNITIDGSEDDLVTAFVAFDGATAPTPGNDTLTIGTHTYQTGDEVVYTSGGGTDIGGLADGTTYYVIYVDGTKVKLAETLNAANANTPIDLTAVGSGTNHRLNQHFTDEHVGTYLDITAGAGFTIDRYRITSIDPTTHGAYLDTSPGTTSTTGGTGNIKGVQASASLGFVGIDLVGNGSLNGNISTGFIEPGYTPQDGKILLSELFEALGNITDFLEVPEFDGSGSMTLDVILRPDLSLISLGTNPQVLLTVNSIGNPFAETTFSNLNRVDSNTFTISGDRTSTFTTGTVVKINLGSSTVPAEVQASSTDGTVTFDGAAGPNTGADTLTIGAHTFITGDGVVYTNGGDSDIGGLSDGTTYFVIVIDGTTVKLADTFANANDDIAIDLTAAGSGANHRLTNTTVDLVSNVLTGSTITSVTAPTPPAIVVTFPSLPDVADLLKFEDISFSNILDALSDLLNFLKGIEGLEFLDQKIPLINKSASDLLSLADKLTTALDEITSDPAGTIQLVEAKLRNALGLPISGPSILSLDGIDNLLKFELGLDISFNESLGVDIPEFLDLGSLSIPGLSGPIGLGGSADLNASGSLTANLDFGIDLGVSNPLNLGDIYIYDTTGVEAEISASGENLSFWASLGPFGLFIQNHPDYDSEISIGGTFSVNVNDDKDNTDNKAKIGDVLFDLDNFDTEITGTIEGTLPTFFPMESTYVGNITLTDDDMVSPGNLANIANFELITDAGQLPAPADSIVLNAADVINKIKNFDFANQFNLFDNILLAVDGIDMFLEGIQYLLDTEIFSGLSLPVIGNPFTEGADFIEDFREDFVEPLRKLIEEVENAAKDFADADKNIISGFLYDILGGLLQETDNVPQSGDPDFEDFQGYYGAESNKLIGLTTNLDRYVDPDPGEDSVDLEDTYVQWNMSIGDTYDFGTDFGFDVGVPGLGIEADGDVSVKIEWDLDFGFGISFQDGFYLDISDENELTASLIVELGDTTLTGTLGFLQLTAAVNEVDLGLAFAVNIEEDGATGDDADKLTFTELGKIDIGFGIAAEAIIDLNLELGLSSDVVGSSAASGFPKVSADFILDWGISGPGGFNSSNPELSDFFTDFTNIGTALQNSLKYVGFQNITLDLGSFVSDVLGPIVGEVQEITEPIQPLIDFITTPFPVLSDFGLNITPLDLAAAYGQIDPGLIYAIADIITLINKIPDPDEVGSLKITILDNLPIYDGGTDIENGGSVYSSGDVFDTLGGAGGDLWNSDFDLSAAFDTVTGYIGDIFGDNWFSDALGALAGEAADIMGDLTSESGGKVNPWAFPIIEDPMQVLGLLMGRPAVLVTYDMEPLVFEFEWSQFFSIWGPLGVSINVEFGATIDFAFGYDTLGIQEFIESDFRNPLLLFDGFYVSDTDLATGDFGTDVPELVLNGGLWAAAEINLGVARAGVGGGVFIEIDFDLFDPDRDGRVRIKELIGNIVNEWEYGVPALAPLAIFDVHGEITAKLFAFLKIDLFLFEIDKRWNITPEITILEFDIPFTRPPILATELDGGDLQINAGPYADQRLNGNINDIAENFEIKQDSPGGSVFVRAPGLWDHWQEYSMSSTGEVIFKGGEGDDTFNATGMDQDAITFEIDGGVGNDTIKLGPASASGAAVITGSEGDDTLIGGSGDDIIYGLKGNDTIYGGGGNDIIFGDNGRIATESITAFFNPTEDGNDTIYGEGGNDIIFGSGGVDTIYGDDDNSVSGGSDKDIIIGDGGKLTFKSFDGATDVNASAETLTLTGHGLRTGQVVVYNDGGGTAVGGLSDGTPYFVIVQDVDTIQLAASPKDVDDDEPINLTAGSGTEHTLTTITGTQRDRIDPKGGSDILIGSADIDVIFGGTGNDVIDGGDGKDVLYGEEGIDTIYGGSEADIILGGEGGDTIYGDRDGAATAGKFDSQDTGTETGDLIYGEAGRDTIFGDADNDTGSATGDDKIYGGAGADTIDGDGGNDTIFGEGDPDWIHGGSGNDILDGGAGNDVVFGDRGFEDISGTSPLFNGASAVNTTTNTITLGTHGFLSGQAFKYNAGGGNPIGGLVEGDTYYVIVTSLTTIKLADSKLDAWNGNARDITAVGSGASHVFVPVWNPTVYGNNTLTNYLYLFGVTKSSQPGTDVEGDDDIRSGMGSDLLDGQWGDDTYRIRLHGADNDGIISAHDSGDSSTQRDIMRVKGTLFDDIFLLRKSSSSTGLSFVALLNDAPYAERINYWSVDGGLGLERMLISGLLGNDHFASDDVGTDTTLEGNEGEDTFQVGQLYHSPRDVCAYLYNHVEPEDVFATIQTTVGWLSDGINQPMTIYGGVGNDYFTVFHNKAVLSLFGEDGDDTFLIKAFALAGSQEPFRDRTDVSGGAGVDLIQYAMNAPVNIDGGDGFDRVIIIGTEFGDDFVVTRDGVFGAGLNVNFVNIESLSVDGAEGDDRFYVLSTGEDFMTELYGGLGSDTFNMSGPTPPIISNDLRGHSGIITHEIENTGTSYDETIIAGISANIADNEEAVVVISEPDGSTVITEGGPYDSYYIVLSAAPIAPVTVQVNAPVQTLDQEERKSKLFQLSSPTEENFAPDRTTISLVFTPFDWFTPQEVRVSASNPIVDYDDDAIEGDQTGFINHVVTTGVGIEGEPDLVAAIKDPVDSTKYTTEFVDANPRNAETDLFEPFTDALVGKILRITDGPGAGQSMRILGFKKDEFDVPIPDTLILDGKFRGCEDSQVGPASMYKITRDIEAHRAITVLVHDNEKADVTVTPSDDSTELFENGATDTIDIVLTREPTGPSPSDVTVTLSSLDGQVSFSDTSLVFDKDDGDLDDWNDVQTVTITAVNDGIREGFHHGLITFTSTGGDSDRLSSASYQDTIIIGAIDGETAAYVGLLNRPALDSGGDPIVSEVKVDGDVRPAEFYEIISNKIVFLTAGGDYEELAVGTQVDVTYQFDIIGYNGRFVKPHLTNIADDEVPQVKITETGDGTDVIEIGGEVTSATNNTLYDSKAFWGFFDPWNMAGYHVRITEGTGAGQVREITSQLSFIGAILTVTEDWDTNPDATSKYEIVVNGDNPWVDSYDVVLTQKPDFDVEILVDPQITKTSSGKVIRWGEQVWASSTHPDAVNNGDGTVTLKFTPANWDTAQTVYVTAVADDYSDGDDTQVFAPEPHTISGIQGPLYLYGEGGNGSIVDFEPTMLHYETNYMPETDTVESVGIDGTTMTVDKKPLFDGAQLLNDEVNDLIEDLATEQEIADALVDEMMTITLADGIIKTDVFIEEIGQFRQIVDAVYNSGTDTVTLTLNEAWDLTESWAKFDDDVDDYDMITEYTITEMSPNFFAIEEEKIDYLFVYNEDSQADNEVESRAGWLTDSTTIGYAGNSIVESFVTNQDGKWLRGFGMAAQDLFLGGVWHPRGITYGDMEVVEINLGDGVDNFTVEDTHVRSDGYQTWTIINTGDEPALDLNLDGEIDGDIVNLTLQGVLGELYAGTVTDQSSNTLEDSSAAFANTTFNGKDLVGFLVEITGGKGVGQQRVIASNTETELTLEKDWDVTLDGTSKYRVLGSQTYAGAISASDLAAMEALVLADPTLEEIGDLNVLVGNFSGFAENELAGHVIEIIDGEGELGVGTKREIIANDATTVTVSSSWNSNLDDTVAYRIHADWDGPIAVNAQSGRDVVDGSTSDIPLVIFGGAGQDELTGGSGDDIIFGDRGRVEYVNEAGKIVTLLGLARELLDPQYLDDYTINTLTDDNGSFPVQTIDMQGLEGFMFSTPDGRGFAQRLLITDNDSDTLTFTPDWDLEDENHWTVINGASDVTPGADTITITGHTFIDGDPIIYTNGGGTSIGGLTDMTTYYVIVVDTTTIKLATSKADALADTAIDITSVGVGSEHILYAPVKVVPDPYNPITDFDAIDPQANPTKYRISLIPEDQTDGVKRDPVLIMAIDPLVGDDDVIIGNEGNDRIFGGAADDTINGNDGDDTIFGDHGRLDYTPVEVGGEDGPVRGDFVPASLNRVRTTYDDIGGGDTIHGDANDDIILGGYNNDPDNLFGDTGNDFLVGDNGVMLFVPNTDTPEDPRDVWLDEVESLSHSIGGTDVISGNEGNDIAIGGTDADTIYGDDASATAGELDGEDILIGDNGHIDFTPGVTARLNAFGSGVNLIETTDVLNTTGGGDYIEGNAQTDVILGGVNNNETDTIYGDAATPGNNDDDDVILGDNGQLDFAYGGDSDLTTLDLIRSLPYDNPDTPSVILGGVDNISGDAGNDTIIGGVDGDTIYGDDVAANNGAADGKDVLIGDNGEIFLSGHVLATLYALGSGINLIQTTDDEEATGGADFIEGNADNDVILGGVNDGGVDVLHGDAAAPSVHDGEDILIGDNGEVDYDVDGVGLTTLDLITTNTYATDEVTVLGGRDRIFGNAYNDVALGGSADDDIIGDNYETAPGSGVIDGLYDSPGDDTIIGDQGHVVYVNGLVTLIETLDLLETDGGSDYVQGNDMEDIILGGVDGDILIGESETVDLVGTPGDDIIIGDEGRLRYDVAPSDGIYGSGDEDPNTLDLIETFNTGVLGGDDIVYGNEESDIVMGGSADDNIFGDFYAELFATGEVIDGTLDAAPVPGTDVLIGDGGQMTFFDNAVTVIRTIEPSMGGSDHIEGHDLTDKILGGVDDDELYGESPETDLPLIESGAGDDWMLGDNGLFDYVLVSDNIEDRHDVATHLDGGTLVVLDPDSSTLDIVTTTDVNDGGNDVMYGNGGNDVMFGGTATDTMRGDTTDNEANSNPDGDDGIDLMFGDHAKIFPTLPTVDDFFVNNNFFSINTQVEDDGFDDIMFGNGNDDIMIGGQGDDIMFGGNGDDDMIGGFNVANGDDELDDMPLEDRQAISPDILAHLNAADVNEINDIMDGGADDDVMTGDNAYVIRQPYGGQPDALASPRFRLLGESGLLYVIDSEMVGGLADIDVGFHANVTADYQPHQDMTLVRTVFLYNHDEATEDAAVANPNDPRPFGNDVMTGGTQDDEIWGQLGDDIIQGDGQILMLVGAEKPAEFKEFNPAQDAIPDFDIRDAEVLDTLAFGIETTFRFSAFEDEGDGDDYIEGNGGNDRIYGGLGQDDLIGGSSILFGLDGLVTNRPDGADMIYGGAGNPVQLSRNASFTGPDNDISGDASVAVPTDERHARDADVILGDNGEIYCIVTEDPETHVIGYEAFNYDYDATTANGFVDDGYNGEALRIIPRAIDLNDYGYSYADADNDPSTRDVLTFTDEVRGEGDLIYGESGDDVIHGMTGNDAIFGNSEHDDIYGEIGTDFLLGGTGIDGILGDDGLILTRRNDLNEEPLYGIDPRDPEQVKVKNNEEVNTNALNAEISTPGNIQRAILNIEGELVKVIETFAFRTDDLDGQTLGEFDDSMRFNDIIFGGLDNDFIHGIDGDDAISGAEALPVYYSGAGYGFEDVNTFLQNMQSAPPNGTPDLADDPFWFGFAPYNPGEILRYEGKTIVEGNGQNPKTRDEFAWYDEFNPRRKIMFDFDYDFGTLPGEDFAPLATETGIANTIDFLLNFNEDEGPLGYHYLGDENAMQTDGNDRIFGDVGNDWLVGGTGRDNMYGGRGNDLLNMDDNHDSGPGGRVGPHDPLPDPLDNTQSDEFQAYADIVYAGAGRDVMILNTGADRSIDWVGEFNSYIVPFSPFGAFHISRNLSPHVPEYLQDLSENDGADVRVDPGKLNNVPDAQLYVDQKNIDVRIDEPDPLRNYEPYGELGMVRQQDLNWGEQTGAPNDPQPGNLQGKRDIMRRELFQDTVAPKGAFAETEGIWTASDGKLEAAPVILGEDAVSIYHLDKMQPSYMEILVTINAEKDKAGLKSNAYIIFDYKSSTDFKFAGVDVGIDKIQIGHYTADGWIVDSQIPMHLKADIDYDLTLVMYGTVATIWVNGKSSLSFDFNDALNDDGLIGLATNNAVARFDDWQVQKLPPTLTFQFTEDFAGTSTNPFKEQTGNWMITDGHYSGSVVDGDRAITTWALEVATWSLLEFEALIDTGTTGGLIFDYYDADNFKFAAIDALNDQVVIGHHTSKGWYIDASVERVIKPGTSYALGISMLGTSVNVTLDGEAVVGHVFNSLLNDGDLGLLSKDGVSNFDDVVAQGDDPAYAEESGDALKAATLGDATDITELNHTELAPIIDAAIDYWVDIIGVDASQLADVSFFITDLSEMFLALTVGNTILIDTDAAGYGWFVDETPYDNIEFVTDGGNGELVAAPNSEAEASMDLLTVVTHELGHVLGLEDVDTEEHDLMSDTLATGVRRVYDEAAITSLPLDGWTVRPYSFNNLLNDDIDLLVDAL